MNLILRFFIFIGIGLHSFISPLNNSLFANESIQLEESFTKFEKGSPCVIVIFGATGDLTARKLIPAIYHLNQEALFPIRQPSLDLLEVNILTLLFGSRWVKPFPTRRIGISLKISYFITHPILKRMRGMKI